MVSVRLMISVVVAHAPARRRVRIESRGLK
jgi:hypothetical protein